MTKNHIFVRPAVPDDAALFLEWQRANPNFDPAAALTPDSFTLVAFDNIGQLAFLPIQRPAVIDSRPIRPYVLESMAFRPGVSNLQIANAMRELIQAAITLGFVAGVGEIYFIGDHDNTNKFAEQIFEKIEYPVYRLKLADL